MPASIDCIVCVEAVLGETDHTGEAVDIAVGGDVDVDDAVDSSGIGMWRGIGVCVMSIRMCLVGVCMERRSGPSSARVRLRLCSCGGGVCAC